METDASGYTLGVVIAQEYENGIHPIAFHSRSLLAAKRNYNAYDKEMLGVVYGLKMVLRNQSKSEWTTKTSNTSTSHRNLLADK